MKEEIVELWKELNLTRAVLTFDCGGDSMGEMEWTYFGKKNLEIQNSKTITLTSFFENEVFNQIDFYVNSDGYYIGENGTVTIVLDDDDEFDYWKNAISQFCETHQDTIYVELTDDEKKFFEEKIQDISHSWSGEEINYKVDFILSDSQSLILEGLKSKLSSAAHKHEFEIDGEPNDECNWSTYVPTEINSNKIKLIVSRQFYEYRDSD